MIISIIVLFGSSTAIPLPQLTLNKFQEPGRDLDTSNLFVSPSYRQVRRQGKKGGDDYIKFPTLVVRNPMELAYGNIKINKLPSGPVYSPNANSLTEKIKKKIKQVNDDEIKKLDKELLDMNSMVNDISSKHSNDKTEELEIITNKMASAIVAQEIEELTDVMAEEIVINQLEEELVKDELLKELSDQVVDIIMDEESVEESLDINMTNEETDLNLQKELVKDELLEELSGQLIDMVMIEEPIEETLDINMANEDTDLYPDEEDEGSGSNNILVDFGDIQEV